MSLSHTLGSSQNTLLPGEWNPFPRAYLLAFPHSSLLQSYFHQRHLCVTHWPLLSAFIPTPKAHPEPGRAQIKCIQLAKKYVRVFHTLMKNLNEIFGQPNIYVKALFWALCHPNFIGSSAIPNTCLSLVALLFSCSVMSNSLGPHGLQHTRLSCPSPSPRACSNSCPLNWWCHLILCHPLLLP